MKPVWILVCYCEESINENKPSHTESNKINEHPNIENIQLPKVMTAQFLERNVNPPTTPYYITDVGSAPTP